MRQKCDAFRPRHAQLVPPQLVWTLALWFVYEHHVFGLTVTVHEPGRAMFVVNAGCHDKAEGRAPVQSTAAPLPDSIAVSIWDEHLSGDPWSDFTDGLSAQAVPKSTDQG